MAKFIDRNPPELTGDAKKDLAAMQNYLYYLREQVNFILSTMNKNGG